MTDENTQPEAPVESQEVPREAAAAEEENGVREEAPSTSGVRFSA
jgi:hypothetical protein